MRYLPHTDEDVASMLDTVGVDSLKSLFSSIPQDCWRDTSLDLPEALTEWELNDTMAALSDTIANAPQAKRFIGAGSYEHHIPAVVSTLMRRSEFMTCYTPYQPEMSQGTLQAIYEYQTLLARLLGMEVANASLYDGASALAEALLMAVRITRRQKVALSRLIHPHYRAVVKTYLGATPIEIVELPYTEKGTTDVSFIGSLDDLAAVAVQSPNFLGCIEQLKTVSEASHDRGGLFVACFTEPLAFGVLKSPGVEGADIACGEGQSFGIPQSFGGPGLGMFASKMKYVRNMPGRLVGQTTDKKGRRGFVLTLATREQHIRREKATSNICTNNSLCALSAAMYMSALGGTGLKRLARLNYDKAAYLKEQLSKSGVKVPFDSPTFNEFVVEMPPGFDATHKELIEKGMVAGLPLVQFYPELKSYYLLCVTETKSKENMDALVKELSS
jgi:glycine dehydrogenase subunit 1